MNLVAKLKKALRSVGNAIRYGGETISVKDDAAMSILFGKESDKVRKSFKVIYDDRMGEWDVPTHPYTAEIRKEFGSVVAFMKQYAISITELHAMKKDWENDIVNFNAMREYDNIITSHCKEVEDAKHFIARAAAKRHIHISFERGIHIEEFSVMKYGRVIAYISMW